MHVPSLPEDDADIPPLVSCAVCGSASCVGCYERQVATEASPLRWEDPRQDAHWWRALWSTAEAITLAPEEALAEVNKGSVLQALSFALTAESVAVASLAYPLLGFVWLLFPEWSQQALLTPGGLALVIASVAGFAALVVVLHTAFGFAFEVALGNGQSKRDIKGTLRFSLYACGWDLWTSPCGVLMGLVFRSERRPRGISIVFAATRRAPRAATTHYVKGLRGLSDQEAKKALRTAVLIAAPLSVITTLAWLSATAWGIARL